MSGAVDSLNDLSELAAEALRSQTEDEAELHKSVDSFVTTFLESENAELTTDAVIAGGGEAVVEQEQIVAQRSAKSAKK